jgi:hypothetical protein
MVGLNSKALMFHRLPGVRGIHAFEVLNYKLHQNPKRKQQESTTAKMRRPNMRN